MTILMLKDFYGKMNEADEVRYEWNINSSRIWIDNKNLVDLHMPSMMCGEDISILCSRFNGGYIFTMKDNRGDYDTQCNNYVTVYDYELARAASEGKWLNRTLIRDDELVKYDIFISSSSESGETAFEVHADHIRPPKVK